MRPSESIKPISYLKAHASEVIRDIVDNQKTMVITQHGKAKVVVQDVRTYERTQESLALLKMLAQSSKSIKEGRFKPVKEAFEDLAQRIQVHRQA
ncbi:MAG: type II toxin-antitoxin system Phd/YefM family antitoxin [Candidatus Neomarinimicrobiota bacterium]